MFQYQDYNTNIHRADIKVQVVYVNEPYHTDLTI